MTEDEWYQCPKWGNLHFYEYVEEAMKEIRGCVNALNGATFISTEQPVMHTDDEFELCQCPEWGNLHFYTNDNIIN